MNKWERFLKLAGCPSCRGKLSSKIDVLWCSACEAEFPIEAGVVRFLDTQAGNKFEEAGFAELYAGRWAFGYQVFRCGEAEGLYRTINELAFSQLDRLGNYNILDIGCGPGRTVCDYARFFKNSFVAGIDISLTMVQNAQRIVVGENEIEFDLRRYGFGRRSIPGFGIDNAVFIQASAGNLPFALIDSPKFDIVISVSSMDRFSDPTLYLPTDTASDFQNILQLMKPGSLLILATPLNWLHASDWERWPTREHFVNWLTSFNLHIDEWFDSVILREIEDANGLYQDWPMLVVRGIKQ